MRVTIAGNSRHDTAAHVSVVCSYGRHFWLASCVCGWQSVWGSERFAQRHAATHEAAARS